MKILMEPVEKFFQRYQRIICFGAGSIFRIMCYELKRVGGLEKIVAVTDRRFLVSGIMEIADVRIPEITQQQALEMMKQEQTGILITTASWQFVVDMIAQTMEDFSYGVYPLLKAASSRQPEAVGTSEKEIRIPPVIHYCWFGKGIIPDNLQKCINSWKKYCPDYQIRLWNENNYDITAVEYTKKAYENRKWAFVTDFVRMDVLYKYGGIYLDTDVELIKNLDELRKNNGFIGTEVSGGINSGLGIGAVPGNKMVERLRMLYLEKDILPITNMGKETELFLQYGYQVGKGYQVVEDMTVYPWQVLSPKIKEDGSIHIGENSYAIHHYEGSWIK